MVGTIFPSPTDCSSMVADQMGMHLQLIKVASQYRQCYKHHLPLWSWNIIENSQLALSVILAVQAKLTGSGYRMLDLQLLSISESKVTRCCWLRWKAFTPCRTLTVLLTFIWGSPTLFWSQLINRHKITTLLSLRVLLHKCSLQPPFFTTVTRQEAFLLLPLVAQLLRLTGLLNKLGLSGTYFHLYVVRSINLIYDFSEIDSAFFIHFGEY